MADKKDPGKFTVRFNTCDPQHRAVIALLNQQGRSKAQFLTNAVLHYINCTNTPEIRVPAVPDKDALEKLIRTILEEHDLTAEKTMPRQPCQARHELEHGEALLADGADLEQWFGGQDGMTAILNSLQLFEQK